MWLINGRKTLSAPFKKWKPEFQLDGRRTLLPQRNTQIAGVRLGVEFKRVHRFGIGVFSWSSDLETSGITFPEENIVASNYNFEYVSLYYERVLLFNRKWEVASTIHFGNGSITRSYLKAGDSNFSSAPDIEIRPLELSASAYYNITWWLSAGGGFGYRFMRDAPDEIKESFNAPVYIIKLKIRLGRLVKSIWKPEVKDEY